MQGTVSEMSPQWIVKYTEVEHSLICIYNSQSHKITQVHTIDFAIIPHALLAVVQPTD